MQTRTPRTGWNRMLSCLSRSNWLEQVVHFKDASSSWFPKDTNIMIRELVQHYNFFYMFSD